MTDNLVERVARAMRGAREAKIARPLSECYPDMARAAIEALRLDMEGIAYIGHVRGGEWALENPLDHEWRFKAAFDFADAKVSSMIAIPAPSTPVDEEVGE